MWVWVCVCAHTCMHMSILIFPSTSLLIFTPLAYLYFSICLWTFSQSSLWWKMQSCTIPLLSCFFHSFSLTNRNSVSMFVWDERWKWFCGEEEKWQRKGGGGRLKKMAESRKIDEKMKYIRSSGARSRGYDLSRHTVVPRWARGAKKMERKGDKEGEDGGKGFTKKEKQELGPRQTNNFSWVKPVSIYQKNCIPLKARVCP